MMTKKTARALMGYLAISDRVIVMKLQATPFSTVYIQVYASTDDHTEEEVGNFFEDLKKVTEQVKRTDVVIILGDRGSRLISFCEESDLVITNTFFQQHQRKLYT